MNTRAAEPSSQSWNVLRLLNWTRDHFTQREVDSPRLAAEVLLARCLDCTRIDLYTRYDQEPSAAQLAAFRELVRRAAAHEPVAYLVGEKEFYSLKFKVNPHVLIPRPETEILVTEAVGCLRALGRPARVWDACTGCGCVGIAIAHQIVDAQVLISDLSTEALAVAQQNVEALGVADRVRCCQADLLDLPAAHAEMKPFDVITANPPYIRAGETLAAVVEHEPKMALFGGADGLRFLRRIIDEAPALLAPGGVLVLEFGFDQGDDVRDLIVAQDRFDEPRILMDHQELERVAVALCAG